MAKKNNNKETYEIEFGGVCKVQIEVQESRIEIIKAVDGWGDSILLNSIRVTTLEQENKTEDTEERECSTCKHYRNHILSFPCNSCNHEYDLWEKE